MPRDPRRPGEVNSSCFSCAGLALETGRWLDRMRRLRHKQQHGSFSVLTPMECLAARPAIRSPYPPFLAPPPGGLLCDSGRRCRSLLRGLFPRAGRREGHDLRRHSGRGGFLQPNAHEGRSRGVVQRIILDLMGSESMFQRGTSRGTWDSFHANRKLTELIHVSCQPQLIYTCNI